MRRRIISSCLLAALAAASYWPGHAAEFGTAGARITQPYSVHTLAAAPEGAMTAPVPAEAPASPGTGLGTADMDTAGPQDPADPKADTAEPKPTAQAETDETTATATSRTAAIATSSATTGPDAAKNLGMAELAADLQQLIAAYGGTWGIVFEELAPVAGEPAKLVINERRSFYAASTMKLPTVLCLYEQAAKGQIDLAETMVFLPEDVWSGAGILQYEKPGGRYSLRYLAELAIRHSDNSAWIMLERRLGLTEADACMTWLGGKATDIMSNETTPRDMVTYLQALLHFQEREPELGQELIEYLGTTYWRNRIPAGLSADIPVANKTGTWPDTNSDVAIVYLPDNPYFLVVYIEGIHEVAATEAIAAAAALVHRTAVERTRTLIVRCEDPAPSLDDSLLADSCREFRQ